jgi:putative intracellular protease/amidase
MERQTVHLFVLDTLADWEAGYAIAGINKPVWQAQPGRFQVATVGMDTEPVRTMGGVTILPDMALDDLDPSQSAMLILPGADAWDTGDHRAVVAKVRAFLAAGVPVAAICGATGFLARAGILDDRRHTSNAPEYLRMTGYGGEALYEDQPAVTDGDLITASSTAPIEFAYQIFKRLDVYDAGKLEAWYGLFKTGDPSHFFALQG